MNLKKYKGLFAEYYAASYLWLLGYKILRLRYRTHYGETDIIAYKKATVVFVEVKYVQDKKYLYRAIYTSNFERLGNNACGFMKNTRYKNINMRFDIIYVSHKIKITHLKNVYF